MRRLLCPLLGLLNRRRSSFDNGIELAVIDDTRVIEQFRLQAHQPGRHLIPDRKDQIDIQIVTHTSSAFPGREPAQLVYSKMFRNDGGMEPVWSERRIFFVQRAIRLPLREQELRTDCKITGAIIII